MAKKKITESLVSDVPKRLPPLSMAERDRRWKLVRKEMKKRGLDALAMVVFSPFGDMSNIAYLSSIHLAGSGGALMVFPLEGEPSVHMAGNLANHRMWLQVQDWVKEFIPVSYPISYYRAAIDRLKELGLKNACVGTVHQADTSGVDCSITPMFVERGKECAPDMTFKDANGLIESIRYLKSEEEIALMQYCTDIGDRAFLETAQFAKSGVASKAVYNRLISALMENGSERTFVLWDAGPSPVHGVWVPDGYILQPGHIIVNEWSPFVRLYQCQFQRPMAVGYVPEHYKRLYDAARISYERGLEALKIGNTIMDVAIAMEKPITSAGYVSITPYFHGIGLSLERPVAYSQFRRDLNKGENVARWKAYQSEMEKMEVQPGLTIAFEPNAVTPDQKQGIHFGDTVAVTAAGTRRMSKLPLDWFIV
jgi:Xaa-Pro aminopeptidase